MSRKRGQRCGTRLPRRQAELASHDRAEFLPWTIKEQLPSQIMDRLSEYESNDLTDLTVVSVSCSLMRSLFIGY